MTEVSAYDAKTHLSKLLARVQRGERITITRHGRPVAELVPVAGMSDLSVEEAIAGLLDVRRDQRLDGLRVRDLIEEGRR